MNLAKLSKNELLIKCKELNIEKCSSKNNYSIFEMTLFLQLS